MTEAISLGIGAGLGILGIVIALVPSRRALAVSLRVLDDDPAPLDRRLPAGRIDTEAGVEADFSVRPACDRVFAVNSKCFSYR